MIGLVVVLAAVTAIAATTARFQSYDADSAFHLTSVHKTAIGDHIASNQAGDVAFGLSARLARADVAWLYVSLVAVLTPLFFLSIYALAQTLLRNRWMAAVATLLFIGPWLAQATVAWAPSTGTFLLQFLPVPGRSAQLILLLLCFAFALRGFRAESRASWGVATVVAIAVAGVYFAGGLPASSGLDSPFHVQWTAATAVRLVSVMAMAGLIVFEGAPPVLAAAVLLLGIAPLLVSAWSPWLDTFALVCRCGVVACALSVARSLAGGRSFEGKINAALPLAIVWFGIVSPLIQRPVPESIAGFFFRDVTNILDASDDPLYKAMARLQPGVAAIAIHRTSPLMMTTALDVVSAPWTTNERQTDNDAIVRFAVPVDRMKALLRQYDCRYVVVPVDQTWVPNGDFEDGTKEWSSSPAAALESVAGGNGGNSLSMTRLGYASQTTTLNVSCEVGKRYRLQGFVKSGTSGDDAFTIEIADRSAPTRIIAKVSGFTSGSWTPYATTFTARVHDAMVILRKNSPTPGSMLFDDISVTELGDAGVPVAAAAEADSSSGAYERFNEHPELFKPLFEVEHYAVYEVVR